MSTDCLSLSCEVCRKFVAAICTRLDFQAGVSLVLAVGREGSGRERLIPLQDAGQHASKNMATPAKDGAAATYQAIAVIYFSSLICFNF